MSYIRQSLPNKVSLRLIFLICVIRFAITSGGSGLSLLIHSIATCMEAMAASVIKYGPVAVEDPTNEEARQNLSWISAMITGGIMDIGGKTDMVLHMTAYGIAAFYEIPHGHGIAILMPRWMEYVLSEENAPAFYRFGENVWGLTPD